MTTEAPRGPVETIRFATAPGLSRPDDAWLTSHGWVVVPVEEIEAVRGAAGLPGPDERRTDA